MLSSDALESEWSRLDGFEGDDHERVIAPVTVSSGDVVDAWSYVERAALD